MFCRFISVLMALVLYIWAPIHSYAITVTTFNGVANTAIGSLVGGKLGYLGESAVISRTLASMGGRVSALSAACGATGPGSALCMVAGSIATGVATCAAMWETGCRQTLEWAYDKSINFSFGSSGAVTVSGTGMNAATAPIYSNGTTVGGFCWTAGEGCWGSFQEALAYIWNNTMKQYPKATYGQPTFNQVSASQVDASYTFSIPELYLNNFPGTKQILRTTANKDCPAGTGIVNGVCTSNGVANTVFGQSVPYTPTSKSVAAAISDIPASAADKPVSNEALAAAANALWKAAAAADSAAASWTQARAITSADVDAWRAANTASIPTVADMAKPLAADATSPASFPYTPSGSGSGSGTGTGSGSFAWICGVSPLPPCSVAVDTAGVPSTVEGLANPTTAIADTFRPLDSRVNDPDKAGLWPAFPLINWSFALPTTCSVVSVPAFSPFLDSVDVCQFQPTFHGIMSVVWVLGGLFGSIGLFWRNVMATA
jgi:hypothetical protein